MTDSKESMPKKAKKVETVESLDPPTPVPWHFVATDALEAPEADEVGVASDKEGEPGEILAIFKRGADARRTVSCIEACNGIPTVLLEGGILTTLIELTELYVARDTCACKKEDQGTKRCLKCLGAGILAQFESADNATVARAPAGSGPEGTATP